MPVNAPHERYLRMLFTRVEATRYPSHQLLDRIEAAITDRETAEAYVDFLLSQAEGQAHPSLRMIDRANEVMAKMAVADVIDRIEDDLGA